MTIIALNKSQGINRDLARTLPNHAGRPVAAWAPLSASNASFFVLGAVVARHHVVGLQFEAAAILK